MEIIRNDWWITPVWEVKTDFDTRFNYELLEEIDEYTKSIPTKHQFDYNIWNHNGKRLTELKEKSLELVKELTHEYVSKNFTDFEYWHTRGWVNSNPVGVSMPIHGHGGTKIAMTYYINADENSGDLLLIDPRNGADWDSEVDIVNGAKFKRVKPKSGKLVFFPAYVLHMVEQNKSNSTRISLTSNLSTIDKVTHDKYFKDVL